MQVTKLQYGRTYPLGNYASERIDMEATIDEGQDPHKALQSLKNQVDNFHKTTNPHLYQEQTPIQYHTEKPLQEIPVSIEQKLSPDEELQFIISSIEACENSTQLNEYQLIAAKNIKTVGAYNKRKKQLNIQ